MSGSAAGASRAADPTTTTKLEFVTMGNHEPTIFNVSTLNALSARLIDHAESITNTAAHQMEIDIRLASTVCDRLVELRCEVAEIAGTCTDEVAAGELLAALRDTE